MPDADGGKPVDDSPLISTDLIDAIVTIVDRAGLSNDSVAALRDAFPDIHFTYCMDDDVGPVWPVREADGFNVYLVDGHNHCLAFTSNPDVATGLVLAEVAEEDG